MSELLSFAIEPLDATRGNLPLLVRAPEPGIDLLEAFAELQPLVDRHLLQAGGILFRGFEVGGAEAFRKIDASFGHPLLTYEFGSPPIHHSHTGV